MKKNILALSIAAMLGGLGFAGVWRARDEDWGDGSIPEPALDIMRYMYPRDSIVGKAMLLYHSNAINLKVSNEDRNLFQDQLFSLRQRSQLSEGTRCIVH